MLAFYFWLVFIYAKENRHFAYLDANCHVSLQKYIISAGLFGQINEFILRGAWIHRWDISLKIRTDPREEGQGHTSY